MKIKKKIKIYLIVNISFRISTERFKKLAEEINSLYPSEPKDIYYVPYQRGENGAPKAARGKLFSTYIYMRNQAKKYGLLPAKNKQVEDVEGKLCKL